MAQVKMHVDMKVLIYDFAPLPRVEHMDMQSLGNHQNLDVGL